MVAGAAGLGRVVRWVHVIDIREITRWVRGGEILLTTGWGWPKDPAQIRRILRELNGIRLAASVWTRDVFRAERVSAAIRAGTVWINDHLPLVSEMPHGGYKRSGFGKDMSIYALEEYTVVKHVMSERTGAARKLWHFMAGDWRSRG